ncbi:hypothetical protein HELRODRAFT_109123 [Helobdella robusta]|uniref:C2H2-type domain-containing protein n=1 Tax=Helobdella robusta TaxID=6412 RepID=T1EEQ6_HELRO|nr:hypothetical protein HELRODRAFT_109123 [Helobdella robusta]ESO10792.1 hypothetical protein HELRODRAFT_109123 [Helobdella robusta]
MISIKNESDIILDENNSYKPSSSSIDGSQVYNPLNSTDDYLNFITNPALNRSVGNQSQPDLPVIYGRRQKMKKIISGTKTKYVCQICNKLFAYSSALIHHENSAHNRRPHPFKCLICGKGFWNQRSHRGHMTSKHLMQTEYCCPVCQKEYAYKVSLKEHMKLNHNIIQ